MADGAQVLARCTYVDEPLVAAARAGNHGAFARAAPKSCRCVRRRV